MDLKAARTDLAMKQAIHDRIAGELARVKASLDNVQRMAQEAKALAKEKASDAVIAGTASAKAEADQARASLTATFEEETRLLDQIPILDNALGKITPELTALRHVVAVEEKTRMETAVRGLRDGALEKFREAAAELTVVRHQGQPISTQLDPGDFAFYVSAQAISRRADEMRAAMKERVLADEEVMS